MERVIDNFRMITCPLCSIQEDVFVRIENGYRICKCSACGLLYVNPQPLPDYSKDDFQYYRGSRRQAERLRGVKGPMYAEGLALFHKLGLHPDRLLDVGCGYGNFLLAAAERGWSPYGVDVSEAACAYATNELHLHDVQVCTLHQANFPDEFFTAVTLWSVLEHVPAPLESLREIGRVLRPGGAVLIRVPNMTFWDLVRPWLPVLQKLRGKPIGYMGGVLPPLHLFGYGPRTLGALLAKAGFVDVHVTLGRMRERRNRSATGRLVIRLASRAVSSATRGELLVGPVLRAWGRK